MNDEVTTFVANEDTIGLVLCLFFKFAIGLCIFKTLGRGNTKEITGTVFMFRLMMDAVFAIGIVYLYLHQKIIMAQALVFLVPIII